MLVDSKLVGNIIKVAFPDVKKKATRISPQEKVSFGGNYWSEGHCNYYVIVNLADMSTKAIPQDNPLRYINDTVYDIKPGFVVVIHRYCGVREYVEIICHPANMPINLEDKREDFTQDELCVLYFTRCYKASYGGLSNYRYHECKSFNGITSANWELAKTSLISRGLLNKAGALTISGKNSCEKLRQNYTDKLITNN